MSDITKIFKTRDSATAALRKAGFDKSTYAARIGKKLDGTFEVDLTPVKKAVERRRGERRQSTERTVTSVARDLIVAGKSNREVWEIIQKEFNLPDSKRGYPAWYRFDCRRQGLIK